MHISNLVQHLLQFNFCTVFDSLFQYCFVFPSFRPSLLVLLISPLLSNSLAQS
ncbi:hypothetical protein HanHA300_Chr11g0401851 [Helianthus annuus]|nr:hypothetical protein HanHA300_Chr11g0401851 [Helianthus annuus]KAJ0509346.1 hypothetical protein HanIR_Chr11g0527791 [Helianthus annuus]KAJ0517439.1 hypothetical protein HanHA89_Chr11g0425351 [Helianthus annuus]KAJ0685449.1 hypothetical protein HanLR1_Chr11g0402791 [Helianthus annuus]KAJ0689349.1 hypothetical protein HanOQP8_Chr11g0404691 [Helianthus annuus]